MEIVSSLRGRATLCRRHCGCPRGVNQISQMRFARSVGPVADVLALWLHQGHKRSIGDLAGPKFIL